MRSHMDTARANRMGIRRLQRAAILAAALAAVAIGVEGRALAQPEPPHFEATVLERVEPRNGFRDYGYRVWSMADDGTVYGSVYDQRGHTKAIKSKVGEGTTWLLPRDPGQIELRPIAASTSGVVLILHLFGWPENYIYVPGHGGREINSLHPDLFFAFDMNNAHHFAGQTGVNPRRAVVFRPPDQFDHLFEGRSAALKINQVGSVIGFIDSTAEDITFRVWHGGGRQSDFVVPRLTVVDVADINNHDDVAGYHLRHDASGYVRKGGWFWSERTGLVEIPFRYIYPEGGFDVQIFGISDDGWVLGQEARTDGPEFYREGFLWHVDAGFVDLATLWEWQGRFDSKQVFRGAVNGPGQMAIETFSVTLNRWVYVFLNRVK